MNIVKAPWNSLNRKISTNNALVEPKKLCPNLKSDNSNSECEYLRHYLYLLTSKRNVEIVSEKPNPYGTDIPRSKMSLSKAS
jgi:hypothetical protein